MLKKLMVLFQGLLFAGCSTVGVRSAEEPEFAVLLKEETFEVRQYVATLEARTVVEGDYENNSSVGFKRLAGYIFGKNTQQEKMAMTAPVLQQDQGQKIAMTAPVLQQQEGERWTMTFILPSQFTLETVPKPLDPLVTLHKVPGRTVATIRYSGSLSENTIRTQTERLQTWMEDKGLPQLSSPRSAGYDPPWTLPFMKRNEIHIDTEYSSN